MRALIAAVCLLLQGAARPASSPVVMWHTDGAGHGRPAIDGGSVYFLSSRHEVVALDASNGTERWRQNTNEPGATTEGSAIVVAGPVVVAGDYNLVAFDRINGTFRWRFVPAVGFAPGIYLGDVSRGLVFAGSPAGRVYAVSSLSGELVWSAVVATDGHTTVFQPATDGTDLVAGFTTFVSPHTGGVVVLDPITGHERWRATFPQAHDPRIGTGSTGNPILVGDLVVASSGDGTIYGFDRAKGFIRWSIPPIPGLPPILQGPFPLPDSPGPDYRPLASTARTVVRRFTQGSGDRVRPHDAARKMALRGSSQRLGVLRAGQRRSVRLRSVRIGPPCRAGSVHRRGTMANSLTRAMGLCGWQLRSMDSCTWPADTEVSLRSIGKNHRRRHGAGVSGRCWLLLS